MPLAQRENCAVPNKKLIGPMVCYMSLSKTLICICTMYLWIQHHTVVFETVILYCIDSRTKVITVTVWWHFIDVYCSLIIGQTLTTIMKEWKHLVCVGVHVPPMFLILAIPLLTNTPYLGNFLYYEQHFYGLSTHWFSSWSYPFTIL